MFPIYFLFKNLRLFILDNTINLLITAKTRDIFTNELFIQVGHIFLIFFKKIRLFILDNTMNLLITAKIRAIFIMSYLLKLGPFHHSYLDWV